MQRSTLALGLNGRKLTDKDIFSKSDPYVVISRPLPSGGWTTIRTSETKKNNLNPEWSEFLIYANELPGSSDDLKIEVFDDDGKAGPGAEDESIGVGHFSLSKLEQAHKTKTSLPITDKRWGKSAGQIVVRSFRMNGDVQESGSGRTYPPQKVSGGGYPSAAGNYSQPQTGYPPQSGYPPHAGTPNVHTPQNAYPPQTGYPPNASSLPYPPQPVSGGGFGGGFSAFSKPANTLNGQMARTLEMQNPASGHAGGFAFSGR